MITWFTRKDTDMTSESGFWPRSYYWNYGYIQSSTSAFIVFKIPQYKVKSPTDIILGFINCAFILWWFEINFHYGGSGKGSEEWVIHT